MDTWRIKEDEINIDILCAASFTVDGSPAEEKRMRKYQTD
jgi:hypothetical protein